MPHQYEDAQKSRLKPYGFRLDDGAIAIIQQLCRIRRYRRGWTVSQTISDLFTRALTEELEENPSIAIIATRPRQRPRKSTPPPAKVVSDFEW